MTRRPVSHGELVDQLRSLGVVRSSVLLVHTAFSKVRPIEDGPTGLIAALHDAIGPDGTLVMPSMSDDDEHPFDRSATPCRAMGAVADVFWRRAGVLRSNSPHAFAATGALAAQITAAHPHDVPHGLDSPVGRVYELGGQVLLLGVGHDANTMIHLAEAMAPVRYGVTKYLTLLEEGQPTRVAYRETDHCCENFALLDGWLEAEGGQRRGRVGHGDARLAAARDIVAVAVRRLRENDTVFLHPPGVDSECDEARASLGGDVGATGA